MSTALKSIVSPRFDIEQIGEALIAYHRRNPKACFEIRALKVRGGGTVSGYFRGDQIAAAAQAAARYSGKASAIYFTLNSVTENAYARSPGKLTAWSRRTTNDGEIKRRLSLPIDFDVVRPPNTSSTDAEHEAALKRAIEVAAWLRTEFKFPDPIRSDSGNGAHLNYYVNLPNIATINTLFQQFMAALSRKLSDKRVKIDAGVYNAARIWKLPGTLACKGDDSPERPHRLAKLIEVPNRIGLVTTNMITGVIKFIAAPVRRPTPVTLTPLRIDDKELLKRLIARGGQRFHRLFLLGDLGIASGDHSKADFMLLCQLLEANGGDVAQAERVFGLSALGKRSKWRDRVDYRLRSVRAALAAITGDGAVQ